MDHRSPPAANSVENPLTLTAAARRSSGLPTVRDVAKLAGVSYTTVSRVLNNKGEISEATRRAVRRAIADVGYVPNRAARTLATGKTSNIGFVAADFTNFYMAKLARGIQRAADSRCYSLSISMFDGDSSLEVRSIRFLAGRVTDGLVVTGPPSEEGDRAIIELADSGIPFVLIFRRLSHPRVSCIVSSAAKGAYLATKHLFDLGHRRIAHIRSSRRLGGRDKLEGYTTALRDVGLPLDPSLIVESDYGVDDGQRATEQLLRLPDLPTAIFATNDFVAIGAIAAVEAAGLKVPDDVSVVGFDDTIFARTYRPPLTSVTHAEDRIGDIAGELLRMLHESVSTEIAIDCELVVRGSTAPRRRGTVSAEQRVTLGGLHR